MSEQSDFNKFKQDCVIGMNKYVLEFGYQSYENAPPNLKGKALTAYYISDILADLKNLDEDTIEEGLALDKTGDLGVDFVHQADSTHHIYQSKLRAWGGSNSLTTDDVLKFIDTHRKITDRDELNSRGNVEVKAYFEDVKPRDEYVYYLICNKPASDAVKRDFAHHCAEAKKKYKKKASWFLCDADVLVNDWTRAKTQLDSIPGQVRINFDLMKGQGAVFEVTDYFQDDQISSLLCLVKGTELKNLYKNYQDALFSYNIRGYLGKNLVNEGIEKTINEEPEHFYFFNNGISAICKNFKLDTGNGNKTTLKCENFQIINGAQTVSVIFESPDEALKKVRVLMRVTSTQDEKVGSKINQKIIQFNNSQSQIKDHDHRANDEVQVALEKYFRDEDIKYKGCTPFEKIFYVRKRIDKKRLKGGWKIDLPELTRALCAFKINPISASSSPKKLFDASDDGLYWQIFGEDGGVTKRPSELQFHEVASVVLIWFFIKQSLNEIRKNKEGRWSEDDRKITQAKWHYLRCFGLVINNLYDHSSKATFFNKLKQGKSLDLNQDLDVYKKWFRIVHQDIKDIYKMTFEREAKGIWRNWLRDKKVLALLEDRYLDNSRVSEYFIR